jgi:hypothetical protein
VELALELHLAAETVEAFCVLGARQRARLRRPPTAEAYALVWNDALDDRSRRQRLRVQRAISGAEVTTTKSGRGREPELFKPVVRELVELYLSRGRPESRSLVFPDSEGGHIETAGCGRSLHARASVRSARERDLTCSRRPRKHLRAKAAAAA